jgi:hypothetical protein
MPGSNYVGWQAAPSRGVLPPASSSMNRTDSGTRSKPLDRSILLYVPTRTTTAGAGGEIAELPERRVLVALNMETGVSRASCTGVSMPLPKPLPQTGNTVTQTQKRRVLRASEQGSSGMNLTSLYMYRLYRVYLSTIPFLAGDILESHLIRPPQRPKTHCRAKTLF